MSNSEDKLFQNKNILPVILSGGKGTRLWPLSRTSLPKQYLNLETESELSLLQDTFLRLKGLEKIEINTFNS